MASSVEETINSSSRSSSTVVTSTSTTMTTTTTTKRRQLPMPPTIMLSSCDLSPSSAVSVPIPMPIDSTDTTTDVNNNRVDHKKLSLERPSSGFNPSNRRHSNTSRRLSNSAIGALDYLDLSQLGQALANSAADDSCSSAKVKTTCSNTNTQPFIRFTLFFHSLVPSFSLPLENRYFFSSVPNPINLIRATNSFLSNLLVYLDN